MRKIIAISLLLLFITGGAYAIVFHVLPALADVAQTIITIKETV